MPDDIISEVDETLKRARDGRVRLQTLLNLKKKMMAERNKLEATRKKVGNQNPVSMIKSQMESAEAKQIVLEEALKAARKTKEFRLDAYVELLETHIHKAKGLIKFIPDKDGKKGYKIILNMNAIGTLADWESGIKAWRDELGYDKKMSVGKYTKSSRLRKGDRGRSRSGKARSYNWSRLFAPNAGRFSWVVEERAARAHPRNAGFWEILDKGTASVKLKTDLKGGYATPVNPPTRFVDKARTELRKMADKLIKDTKADVGGDFEDLDVQIEKIDERLAKLLQQIVSMTDLSSKDLDRRLNRLFPDLVSKSNSVISELELIADKQSLAKVHWTEKTRTVTIGKRIREDGEVVRVRRSVARLKALMLSTFIGE